jgi:hypothetical protein
MKNEWHVEVYSEHGLDQRLKEGYFNATASPSPDFVSYWVKVLRRLEELFSQNFPHAGVDLSYGLDEGKTFAVGIEDESKAAEVLKFLIDYRNQNEPDAAIIAEILHVPVPVARLVIGKSMIAIERDALSWYAGRLNALKLTFPPVLAVSHLPGANLKEIFFWLIDEKCIGLSTTEFWTRIYAGTGFPVIGDEDHETASAIALALTEYGLDAREIDWNDWYVSPRLLRHGLLKIEVSQHAFDALMLRGVMEILGKFRPDWAVRFMIFEDVLRPDSYLGGVISEAGGGLFVEI